MSYSHILSPSSIGNMRLKNRIILSAMGSNFCNDDGSCNQRIIDYYAEHARGGTGLIILETSSVAWPNGATTPYTVGFSDDRFILGLTELVNKVHQNGALIAAQLNHGGKVSQHETLVGEPIMVSSPPPRMKGNLMTSLTPREIQCFVKASAPQGQRPQFTAMTDSDIKQSVTQFTQAASRAQQAGFDAIEIHAGHGYLLSSFLSPAANQRTDQYGGNCENRFRIIADIIQSIKTTLGKNFPIIVRLDATEFEIEGGTELQHSIEYAQLAERAGANAIDVSSYGNGLSSTAFTKAPLVHEPAGLLKFAQQIKQNVTIPIIAVGRISPQLADHEIGKQNIDFIAMGRKLLADPQLANKLAQDPASIRPCIYCYICVSKIFVNEPMTCAVNPSIGRETELTILASDHKKHIAIVGAGPAGMEAARVLSLRGHLVSLYEQTDTLGGTANIAALPYQPNGDLVAWLEHSILQLGVNIHTNYVVDAERLLKQQPDHIILAVGAKRSAPNMNGKHLKHVFDGEQLRSVLFGHATALGQLPIHQRIMIRCAHWLGITKRTHWVRMLSHIWLPLGKHIVLIGGGLVGLELAEFFSQRRRKVSVLEPSTHLGAELSLVRRAKLINVLQQQHVQLFTSVEHITISEKMVQFEHQKQQLSAHADSVIISLGATINNDLQASLQKINTANIPISQIGDCADITYIDGAIKSARELAVTL